MTTPAVIQLQEYATDGEHDISELLRMALVVATKLKLSDFKEWLSNELNGYKNKNASLLPNYRIISSQLKLKDPNLGIIPCIIKNIDIEKAICTVHVHNSISSLTGLVNQSEKEQGAIIFPLSSEAQAHYLKNHRGVYSAPTRIIDRNQIISIISIVRTRILEWALTLEEEGVLGEGLTFSSKEKEIAEKSMTINNIENFQGVLGNVSESTVTQTNHLVVNSGDFNSLAEHLRSQRVEQQDITELHQAITNDPAPAQSNAFGSHVSAWVGKMMIKAADGSWNVGIGAAGGLLANALAKYYGF